MVTRRVFLGSVGAFALAGKGMAAAPVNVVATTGMIADAVRQIGGDLVDVHGLMGPGVDPHSYRVTRSDIVAMVRADLTLWHGLYLEAQLEEFFHDLDRKRAVVPVADSIPHNLLLRHADYADKFDPHVWMAPTLWSRVADAVTDALISVRPDSATTFGANAAAFKQRLIQLESYAKTVLGSVPEQARVLMTAHDAFSYFGRAYGFEVMGIQGISTQSEAGLRRIAEMVDMMANRDIRAVFVESSVSDRNIRALIEGVAAKGKTVRIGGELYSDAMGQPGTYEGTYIGMIDHNVTTISRALGGTAPERGMSGLLSAPQEHS